MKKYLIICLLAALGGCSKHFLDENTQGQVVGNSALSDVTGLDAALTGAYKGYLRTWAQGFLTSAMQGFSMGGDDLTTIPGGNKADFREMDQFDVTADNDRIAQIWNGCYKAIQGANNVIGNAANASGDKPTINEVLGEAYYLRAMGYYWLTRGFGNIPLVTSVSGGVTTNELTMKPSPPADVYKVIESDLLAADSLLPTTKRDQGRPNKGSAEALLADVYLTEGGWPILDNSKYALAAQWALKVMNDSATYGFHLANLSDLWSQQNPPDYSLVGSEEVMAFQTNANYGGSNNAFAGASTTPAEEGGWEDYEAEITFFNNFPEGLRKDLTFHTVFTKSDGTTVTWQNSQDGHPYYAKFRIPNNAQFSSSVPVYMMRWAHVLLIYAEAQTRADGTPDATSYYTLNAVHTRAGLTALSGLSAADFLTAVVNERAWEFACEGTTRWFDLQRLQLVNQYNSPPYRSPVENAILVNPITTTNYWFPAPLADASINPNLD
jgi:starch-binding outer membrane protein, SusD/RagB family